MPTRVTCTSETILDRVLTNIPTDMTAGVFDEPVTDHIPTFVTFEKAPMLCHAGHRTTYRIDYKRFIIFYIQ